MPKEFRIFGCPGTGKTTNLSKKITASAKKFGSQHVMVASFTKTAAIELVGRDLPLPKDNVGTLHSFAFRAIGHPEIAEAPKHLAEWNKWIDFPDWRISGGKTSIDDPYGEMIVGKTEGDRCLQELSRLRTKLAARQQWPPGVQQFESKWTAWKKETNRLDFTDLISEAYERCPSPPIAAVVGYFDEVQDFSPLELSLIRQWGETMSFIVLAGDDDQTIYSFRGSIPDAFLDPPIPDEQKIVLPISFRLPRVVKSRAEEWIRGVSRREDKPFEARDAEGSIDESDATWAMPDRIVVDAIAEAKKGHTCMILASCGYMLEPTVVALKTRGATFHNPYRVKQGFWNPLRGGVDRLLSFCRPDRRVWGEDAHSHTWASLRPWFEHLDIQKTGLRRGAKKKVMDRAADEEWKDQFITLSDFRDFGIDDPPIRSDWKWLRQRLRDKVRPRYAYAFEVCEAHGSPAALRDKPNIVIGTIHSVKGGQADTVFLFPDLSLAASQEKEESVAGEDAVRRMFYVGMTRAANRLVLCQPSDFYSVAL